MHTDIMDKSNFKKPELMCAHVKVSSDSFPATTSVTTCVQVSSESSPATTSVTTHVQVSSDSSAATTSMLPIDTATPSLQVGTGAANHPLDTGALSLTTDLIMPLFPNSFRHVPYLSSSYGGCVNRTPGSHPVYHVPLTNFNAVDSYSKLAFSFR